MESVLSHSRKNPNRKKDKNGKRPLEFLDLSHYPWKFQSKWSFTPWKLYKKCYIHWNFWPKTKNQDPSWKFHNSFWITLWNPTSFLIDPWNFHILFFNNSGTSKSMSSILPVWIISGIAHGKSQEKNKIIYIEMGAATVDSR